MGRGSHLVVGVGTRRGRHRMAGRLGGGIVAVAARMEGRSLVAAVGGSRLVRLGGRRSLAGRGIGCVAARRRTGGLVGRENFGGEVEKNSSLAGGIVGAAAGLAGHSRRPAGRRSNLSRTCWLL